MKFVKGTTILADSPKGRLILRNMEDFPEMTLQEHIADAQRLLDEAAGRKRYYVLSLKTDRANREKARKWRERR